MKIVLIIRQDTQNPMLVLLLIISCYIITFRSNKDDVQNTSRMQDDMSKYTPACRQLQIPTILPSGLCNLICVVVKVK